MAFKYILFHADFDENESSTLDIEDEEHLTKHFYGEEGVIGDLLTEGRYYGEWGNYHLIKLGDYE